MFRRPPLLRVLITLVAAWYSLIGGGQLSLAESVVTTARLATGSQPSQSMPQGATVMAGMDCHRSSFPDGKRHLCLCIDTGWFQHNIALPSRPASQCPEVGPPVRIVLPRAQIVVACADDYRLPPATAPPQA